MRVIPSQPRSIDTVERLKAAARKVVKESGRDVFNMEDVAAESGYAVGTLYRYFGDRAELLDEIWPDRPTEVPW